MNFTIVYSGQLKAGVSKQRTIAILKKITGLEDQVIEDKFFTGKTVRLKNFKEVDQAKAFYKRLHQAGLEVKLKQINDKSTQTVEHTSEPAAKATQNTPEEITPPKARPHKTKKTISLTLILGLCAAVTVVIGVAVVGFWVHSLLKPTFNEQIKHAEEAIYTSNTMALAHINLRKLARIEEVVKNSGKTIPTQPTTGNLIGDLASQGIDVRKHIDHMLYAIDYSESDGATHTVVVTGSFKKSQINAYFTKHYETEKVNLTSKPHTLFKQQNRDTCKYSETQAFYVKDGLLLIANPAKIETLITRLEKTPSNNSIPAQWIQYRRQTLASIGIIQPEHLDKAAGGMIGFMLKSVSGVNTPLKGVYMGIKGNTLPPKITAELIAYTDNAAWLQASETALNQQIDKIKTQKDAPKLIQSLIEGTQTEATSDSISASITINKAIVEEAEKTIQAGVGSLFALSMGSSNNSGEVTPEHIDEQAKPYVADLKAFTPPDYKTEHGEKINWQQGPVAIQITSVGLTDLALTEISLTAKAKALPNLGNSNIAPRGEFAITAIQNASGENILREETCGPMINSDPAYFSEGFFGEIKAEKTIRLKDGASIADIHSISGKLSLTIATQTHSEVLKAPIANKQVSLTNSGNLTIKQAENSTLNYNITGDRTSLLDVRAMNDKQQYLSNGGSFSSGEATSEHKSINQSVQGKIGYVEVTTSKEQKHLNFDFTLKSGLPNYTQTQAKDTWTIPNSFQQPWQEFAALGNTIKVNPNTFRWSGHPISQHNLGPLTLLFFKQDVQQTYDQQIELRGEALVALPYNEALMATPNRVEMHIKTLTLSDGSSFNVDVKKRFASLAIANSEQNQNTEQNNYLFASDRYEIKFGQDVALNETTKLQKLEGDLTLKLPLGYQSHQIPLNGLGKVFSNEKLTLWLLKMEASRLYFYAQGQLQDLANLTLLNAQGAELGSAQQLREKTVFDKFFVPDANGQPNAIIEINFTQGIPSTLIVLEATEQQTETYPFSLQTD